MNFPIYEYLKVMAQGSPDLRQDEIKKIGNILLFCPAEHLQFILALILHHAAVESGYVIGQNILPYNGEITISKRKAPAFQATNLPPLLLKIIKAYLAQVLVAKVNS